MQSPNTVSIRNTYTTPCLNIRRCETRESMIGAVVDQGLKLSETKDHGTEYRGSVDGVAFEYSIASEAGRSDYNAVCGCFSVAGHIINSYDRVYSNAIPDLAAIADIIKAKSLELSAYPLPESILWELVEPPTGLTWKITRNVNISSSGKFTVEWQVWLGEEYTDSEGFPAFRILSATRFDSAHKKAVKIASRVSANDMILQAEHTIQARQDEIQRKINIEKVKASFAPLKGHKGLSGLECYSSYARIEIDILPDQVPQVLAFLASLKS